MKKELSIYVSVACIGLLAIGCGSGKETGYYCKTVNEIPGDHCEGLYVDFEKGIAKLIVDDIDIELGAITQEFGSVCASDVDDKSVYCIGPEAEGKMPFYQAPASVMGDEAAHKAAIAEAQEEVTFQKSLK